MYDHTCQPAGKAPNGNGGGAAHGKPCTGCVGNADDKNPPGQSKVGPGGADHNKGYECENPRWQGKNNGVGKGNPAHSGCTPAPPCTSNCNPCTSNCNPGCTVNCNPGCTVNCTPTPPDCDGDGIDDNVDPDVSGCRPVPPKKDCDGDGVPDDVDSDMTGCEPIPLCPDGSVMPANGKCNPSLVPDFVLGIRVDRKPVAAAALPAVVNKPAPAVAASLLPFTGGNLLPFVLVSAGLIGAGAPALRRRSELNGRAKENLRAGRCEQRRRTRRPRAA